MDPRNPNHTLIIVDATGYSTQPSHRLCENNIYTNILILGKWRNEIKNRPQ